MHIAGAPHQHEALSSSQDAQCLLQRHESGCTTGSSRTRTALANATQEAAAAWSQSRLCGERCPAAAVSAAAAAAVKAELPADAHSQPGTARYAHYGEQDCILVPTGMYYSSKHPATGLLGSKCSNCSCCALCRPSLCSQRRQQVNLPPCQHSLQQPSPSNRGIAGRLG